MSITYSTGPVENAAGNAATSAWVKVLNLSTSEQITVEIKVYNLNGQKSLLGSSTLTILPENSDFEVFNVTDVLQYEIEIIAAQPQDTLIGIWPKDSNADLLAAQRFVQNELNIINADNSAANNRTSNRKPKRNGIKRSTARRRR